METYKEEIVEGLPEELRIVRDAGGAYRLLAIKGKTLDVGIIELDPIDIHSYSPAYKEYLDQVVLRLDFFKNKDELGITEPAKPDYEAQFNKKFMILHTAC